MPNEQLKLIRKGSEQYLVNSASRVSEVILVTMRLIIGSFKVIMFKQLAIISCGVSRAPEAA